MGAPNCPLETGSATYRSNIIYPSGGAGSFIIPYNANLVAGFSSITSVFVRGSDTTPGHDIGPFGESLTNTPVSGSVTLPQSFHLEISGGSAFDLTLTSYDTDPTQQGAGYHVTVSAQGYPPNHATVAGYISACAAVPNLGPSPINLGTAAHYTSLTTSGITNDTAFPGTFIEGDIGASPITGAAIVGISCNNVGGNIITTNGLWVPASGSDTCQITDASALTTAVNDRLTAYNNTVAAVPTLTDPWSSDLGLVPGGVIPPGVYKFSGALGCTQNVILSGSAGATWIFISAGAFTVAANKSITLAGGAVASNVFFGTISATLHAGAHVEGIMLTSTTIAMQAGASVHGRTLAGTALTLTGGDIITEP